jgi:RimJ/RimL family protein N-acetyltransferase
MKRFESERLIFRPFDLEDADAVLAFSSNELVTRYTGDAGIVKNLSDARSVISNVWFSDYEKYGYGRYAVVDKQTERVIGFAGLKFLPEEGFPDLGYRFLPNYWGQGIGQEAAIACLRFAKRVLELKQIIGFAMPENLGSIKILENAGFVQKGLVTHDGQDFIRFELSSEQLACRYQ